MPGPRVTAGASAPLGVWPDADGVNVAVWSGAAQAVDLCLFDADGHETRIRLPERTGEVFHGHVAGVGEGARYGLRVHGPWAPASGLRFDPAKLLLDPYAVAVDGPFHLHPSMFSEGAPGVDSAPFSPKAVVTAEAPAGPPPLLVPWRRTVIYEAHVKGLTRLHPDVTEAERGTFAALAHPAVIAHLKGLGVTTLELLPAAAWIDERHLAASGLTNYWGYNPVAFAAPDPRLAPGGWAEVRAATAALAAAGIETVLDVVFNHSGEGDALGPTVSLRGLDNGGYYRLRPDDAALYIDDSGTGNTLALDRPQGVALVMHALRTWARRGGVSGFRFDLATVLGRRANGFDRDAPLFAALAQDPELGRLKLIAEPWDCGPGGYQLGRFPGGWAEWNDGFRDRVRRFWRGDAAPLGQLAEAMAGSEPSLGAHRRPSRGVNFVVSHDGFTLADLVSYEAKHNLANGEGGRDGADHNLSWNNGVEGSTGDQEVLGRRAADQRALLATLVLSRGTPMLAMGCELGRSQQGNNNAYAQDNAASWLDWTNRDERLSRFVGRLVEARAACPALNDDRFLTGAIQAHGLPDVEWRRADGRPMTQADWDDPRGPTLVCVLASAGQEGDLSRAVIVTHRGDGAGVALPQARERCAWRLVLDTADDDRQPLADQERVRVAARSVTLLVEEPAAAGPRGVSDQAVAELAGRAGVALEWWTVAGERHVPSAATHRALLASMGLGCSTPAELSEALRSLQAGARRLLPFALTLDEGEASNPPVNGPDGWLHLEAEDGAVTALRIRDRRCGLPPLAAGRHRLRLGDTECRLIVAPRMAYEPQPPVRRIGLSAQLYGVRGSGDAGVGDLHTLAELGRDAAARGLSPIGVNPLHALFPTDRSKVSPYYPSDRRFIDPIYIRPCGAGAPLADMSASGMVDYQGLWLTRSAALERDFAAFPAGPAGDFDAFCAEGGETLRDFCLFQAIAERHPDIPWMRWPDGLQDCRGAAARAFARAHAGRLRYHAYLQWRADQQLAQARAAGGEFLRDLAVGPAPDGAETWSQPGLFAPSVSMGAPPDAFSPKGQAWGIPPPLPRAWSEEGFESFGRLLRSNMRHACASRIDHALGLARLFWIPDGADAREGTYVSYPMEDLLRVVALESVRSACLVVGEDLGTAPESLRPALAARRIYSYKVAPFERDGAVFRRPADYPAHSLACVSTHDLPTLAGWWDAEDIAEKARLGLIDPGDITGAVGERQADKRALLDAMARDGQAYAVDVGAPLSDGLAGAVHAWLAESPSLLMLVQMEDLAAERESVNIPGTHLERSNWSRRLPLSLTELWTSSRCQAILSAVRAKASRSTDPPIPA